MSGMRTLPPAASLADHWPHCPAWPAGAVSSAPPRPVPTLIMGAGQAGNRCATVSSMTLPRRSGARPAVTRTWPGPHHQRAAHRMAGILRRDRPGDGVGRRGGARRGRASRGQGRGAAAAGEECPPPPPTGLGRSCGIRSPGTTAPGRLDPPAHQLPVSLCGCRATARRAPGRGSVQAAGARPARD